MPENSFRAGNFGGFPPGCGLYKFAAIINLRLSVTSPVLTKIVANGNGNYELMDNAAMNFPAWFSR